LRREKLHSAGAKIKISAEASPKTVCGAQLAADCVHSSSSALAALRSLQCASGDLQKGAKKRPESADLGPKSAAQLVCLADLCSLARHSKEGCSAREQVATHVARWQIQIRPKSEGDRSQSGRATNYQLHLSSGRKWAPFLALLRLNWAGFGPQAASSKQQAASSQIQ